MHRRSSAGSPTAHGGLGKEGSTEGKTAGSDSQNLTENHANRPDKLPATRLASCDVKGSPTVVMTRRPLKEPCPKPLACAN